MDIQADEQFMRRCIQLARNGLGMTYPNPLVGSVIVHKGVIIGEGWHQKAGLPHAEVVAIRSVKDVSLLPESTLYVNLEPCSHHGKTPPCSDLIVEKRIKRVIIGTVDYNSKVFGKGIAHLQKHGCEVKVGVLEKESLALNKRFFTFHQKKRPFVILKWAQTQDGFMAPQTSPINSGKPEPVWITNPFSLQYVHLMRAVEQSILVGIQTALSDNPGLDTRHVFGENPLRILIDKDLKLNAGFALLNGKVPTLVFNELKQEDSGKNLKFVKLDFNRPVVKQVLDYLYRMEVQSVIVEGGANTLNRFIAEGFWDEAYVFNGNTHFGKGLKAPVLQAKLEAEKRFKGDQLKIYVND